MTQSTISRSKLRELAEELALKYSSEKNAARKIEYALIEYARREAVDEWQDIAIAPKDGEPILAFVPSYYRGKGGRVVVLWLDGAWMDNRAWKVNPTHWQPLPPPPGSKP